MTAREPEDYDPKPHERVWYRHVTSGERSYKVVRDGVDKLRLNRPGEEIVVNLDPNLWSLEVEKKPFTPMNIAQVAHAADKVLCLHLGMHSRANSNWLNMTPEERLKWCNEGPRHPLRRKLWMYITTAFEGDVG